MPPKQKFTVGDLNLRDCWRLFKYSMERFLGLLFLIGVIIGAKYAYEMGSQRAFGTESPLTTIWSAIPRWGKITIISFVILLVLRAYIRMGILKAIGESLAKIDEKAGEKLSFKRCFYYLIGIISFSLPFEFLGTWALIPVGLIFSIFSAYPEIIIEKEEDLEAEAEEDQENP